MDCMAIHTTAIDCIAEINSAADEFVTNQLTNYFS